VSARKLEPRRRTSGLEGRQLSRQAEVLEDAADDLLAPWGGRAGWGMGFGGAQRAQRTPTLLLPSSGPFRWRASGPERSHPSGARVERASVQKGLTSPTS